MKKIILLSTLIISMYFPSNGQMFPTTHKALFAYWGGDSCGRIGAMDSTINDLMDTFKNKAIMVRFVPNQVPIFSSPSFMGLYFYSNCC